MLTRIHRLRNYRIFRDFSWPAGLQDFGRYNVIYGWNGAGKTTLSTLFRHLQRREAVTEGAVEYVFGDSRVLGSAMDDPTIPAVRVFNREFVGRAVFETNSGQFPPVYYFGEDSADKQRQIAELNAQRSLHREEQVKQNELLDGATVDREKFCTDQAKFIRTLLTVAGGGKYNNFNAAPFKAEMQKLAASIDPVVRISDEDRDALLKTKDSRPLPALEQVAIRFPDLVGLRAKTDALLKKTVVSSVLQDLADDQALAAWVGQGLGLHRGAHLSDHCRFCDQPMPAMRVAELEAHFNDEFDRQKGAITELLAEVDLAARFSQGFAPPAHEALYEALQPEYKEALKQIRRNAEALTGALSTLRTALEAKRDDPFKRIELDSLVGRVVKEGGSGLGTAILALFAAAAESAPFLASFEGTKAVANLNRLIAKHNEQTSSFDAKVADARDALAADEMLGALEDWRTKCQKFDQAEMARDSARADVAKLDSEIAVLEAQVQQHHRPAEELNKEVAAYLGRDELQFVPEQSGYRIMRAGQPANHLSDGERTAVAFLYFLKSLQGTDFDLEEGVVVIDDPVSSLDTNSLFSAFGFMKARTAGAKQLIILTHSFSFFRQVRNWFDSLNKPAVRAKRELPARFFMLQSVTHDGVRGAKLGPMDAFLTDFESEYHYLFKQVVSVSQMEQGQGLEQYYGMPNMARRLLESFLAYRIPSRSGDLFHKLNAIEGDVAVKTRVLRFLHTYSHGDAVAQPDHDPTILSETPAVLREVLALVRANDPVHHDEMVALVSRLA
jgi:wobble nucleotide-excising tRNase